MFTKLNPKSSTPNSTFGARAAHRARQYTTNTLQQLAASG